MRPLEFRADGERELIVAVIELAVRDACVRPMRDGKPMPEALNAMHFLFREDGAGVDAYLLHLDVEPDAFRSSLWQRMREERSVTYSAEEQRAFRHNHEAWRDARWATVRAAINEYERLEEQDKRDLAEQGRRLARLMAW